MKQPALHDSTLKLNCEFGQGSILGADGKLPYKVEPYLSEPRFNRTPRLLEIFAIPPDFGSFFKRNFYR